MFLRANVIALTHKYVPHDALYALFCEHRIVDIAHMCTHSQEYPVFVCDNVTMLSHIHVINHIRLHYCVFVHKIVGSCDTYEHYMV